jgi:hypothetical protein
MIENSISFSEINKTLEGPKDTVSKLNPSAQSKILRTIYRALQDEINRENRAQKLSKIYGIPTDRTSLEGMKYYIENQLGIQPPQISLESDEEDYSTLTNRDKKVDAHEGFGSTGYRKIDKSRQSKNSR